MTELSVSSTEMDKNCLRLVKKMQGLGLTGRITPNISILDDGKTEHGCVIRLSRTYGDEDKTELQMLWQGIKPDFGCAHLHIPKKFDGCILDYLRPSVCIYNQ